MISHGIKYSLGRQKPLNAYQRMEAWQQFRRSQITGFQQRSQTFSTSFFSNSIRKAEESSIVAAQSALDRIMSASKDKMARSSDRIGRVFDKKI